MIRLLTTMLRQDAVYWAPGGPNNFGQPTYAAPIALRVRWEDETSEYLDVSGATKVSRSQVYVGQDVIEDGVLWLGSLASLDSQHRANPFLNSGAWSIAQFQKTPTLKADQFLRVAILGGRGAK